MSKITFLLDSVLVVEANHFVNHDLVYFPVNVFCFGAFKHHTTPVIFLNFFFKLLLWKTSCTFALPAVSPQPWTVFFPNSCKCSKAVIINHFCSTAVGVVCRLAVHTDNWHKIYYNIKKNTHTHWYIFTKETFYCVEKVNLKKTNWYVHRGVREPHFENPCCKFYLKITLPIFFWII